MRGIKYEKSIFMSQFPYWYPLILDQQQKSAFIEHPIDHRAF